MLYASSPLHAPFLCPPDVEKHGVCLCVGTDPRQFCGKIILIFYNNETCVTIASSYFRNSICKGVVK